MSSRACNGLPRRCGAVTNFVLIDFESVQPESLEALGRNQFRVIVFIGASQTKIPFEIASALQQMGNSAEYIKISGNGKNALDFHIAFAIGQLSVKDPTAYFHIISKDGGFDPLIQHLKSKKIPTARWSKIEDIPLLKKSASDGKKTTKTANPEKTPPTPPASPTPISAPHLVSKAVSITTPEKLMKSVDVSPQLSDTPILVPQRKVTCPTCRSTVPAVVGQIDFICHFCHGAFRY